MRVNICIDKNANAPLFIRSRVRGLLFGDNWSYVFFVRQLRLAHFLIFEGGMAKIDNLGRLVIPKEYRKKLGIELGDDVDMSTNIRIFIGKNAFILNTLLTFKLLCDSMFL